MTISFGDSMTAMVNDIDSADQELTALKESFRLLEERSRSVALEIQDNLGQLETASEDLLSGATATISQLVEGLSQAKSMLQAARDDRTESTSAVRIKHQELIDTVDSYRVSLEKFRGFAIQTGLLVVEKIAHTNDSLQNELEKCSSMVEDAESAQREWVEQTTVGAGDLIAVGEEYSVFIMDSLIPSLTNAFESYLNLTASQSTQLVSCFEETTAGFRDGVVEVLGSCERAHGEYLQEFRNGLNNVFETGIKFDQCFGDLTQVVSTASYSMNRSMDSSAIGLKKAIETLQALKEILDKVA